MESVDWAGLIQMLGGLGKAGTGIYSAFQKQGYPPGFNESMQAANNASTYANASLDPNSPYYRNLMETEEQRGRTDLITSIDRIMREIAGRGATGRGTINPERRDETIWGILAKGFQEAGMKARETARQRLFDMAGTQAGISRTYQPMMETGFRTDAYNRATRAAGTAGAFDAVSAFGNVLGKRPTNTGGKGSINFGAASVPGAYQNLLPPEYRDWPGNVGL